MQVNLFEARNQLSTLVKAALAGDEVIIAGDGEARVRLVPCTPSSGLSGWGTWQGRSIEIDEAFTDDVDAEVGRLFGQS
jgi:antitoxin (DNA-binding transcriptional repressor) of toxin-antitoxin stability system